MIWSCLVLWQQPQPNLRGAPRSERTLLRSSDESAVWRLRRERTAQDNRKRGVSQRPGQRDCGRAQENRQDRLCTRKKKIEKYKRGGAVKTGGAGRGGGAERWGSVERHPGGGLPQASLAQVAASLSDRAESSAATGAGQRRRTPGGPPVEIRRTHLCGRSEHMPPLQHSQSGRA
ncbi:hypothetical protein SKAU_G00070440 [Synaphobranchus kaupii]|uniref:Uncharacterized protein n=1 Tax=Synaphobranchus kaupii TaxID=118154 RepID=A0A9Q1G7S7_SYNKA|nr:hypothetical protein SKAU_G00070440 [Synaphobranchus kaupii]